MKKSDWRDEYQTIGDDPYFKDRARLEGKINRAVTCDEFKTLANRIQDDADKFPRDAEELAILLAQKHTEKMGELACMAICPSCDKKQLFAVHNQQPCICPNVAMKKKGMNKAPSHVSWFKKDYVL